MLTPKQTPQSHKHQHKDLACKFSLLLWNIHKENQKQHFKKHFHALLQKYPSDILLFQEVKHPKKAAFFFENYSYSLAANIETRQNSFGVMTAALCSFDTVSPALSTKKELGFISHKSFLISQHRLCDGSFLTLVNIHAINFVSNKSFDHEIQRLKTEVAKLDGALILAGDFNTWSKQRQRRLQSFAQELNLSKLSLENSHHVKKIFTQSIDHIYYRGLKAMHATAIDTQRISDHNPIHALFELEK
ncbi:MAG TPA: endonuclease/exonuclease/phosphatase family protein [Sulfurimonas autotrophica]|uniref:Endonuclease/exonuclease/phosphatase family protein n=1 Tax=Sulfurimonas autotrophica TaxID=202747 RepID=A0A7C3CA78_9BACT|nr:endonuclease/exonuclease/phosphatase family protein [Sulfurimonas autotrophica]